ncbi:YjjI family glycine radical enzyme [Pasteurella skyensis]|uniref:YjjI family glycine radical enzyme n=1 Tax=Phocoenobacter skyensis TaxID=97481 RepID=A0AAJ6N832_9PAST|nr:YjjI family glycine radical enzyme [Pasteurella skyensis]MDP8161782.1 YjjI family glycine radical enzyme [Pasteurella skyensis]MDP8171938.1 YjjI family glycine radical enzyme [Pasteurella skyensis]MDP8178193.1 YjjI family glycine radical enzyme [Pasteurella skyensis]MDP8182199.1 YjjI family glycine radical enzyme [Pasteurella skyensis]MDP8188500.1 YjjI family glycine radical enzyme [Pasteurella skyensis]
MQSTIQDILDTVKSDALTCQQKGMLLANIAERLINPKELLNYTEEEYQYIENHMICDLNEGYAIYRPRYILPDYNVYLQKGCQFLDLPVPTSLDEVLDGLLIIYSHVPSITTFPVYIGRLDLLLDPFITDEEQDYIKIKRFLNHVDKTVPDSFCHANVGPVDTKAGRLILKAVIELENPTPNMTIRYDKAQTSQEFAELAAKACLLVSKPSFANDPYYKSELGEAYGIASCYNALPECGGAYTLTRLRLGTIGRACKTVDEMVNHLLPKVAKLALSTMDKRHKFLMEESNFFKTDFLVKEGFLEPHNFTSMLAIVGLADATNHLLQCEGIDETFGKSERGEEIATAIMDKLEEINNAHKGVYVERTNGRYLLHAQVGASINEEDKANNPAHRIRVGQEPSLLPHLKQSAPYHKYFPSGTGDLFAFDQTYVDHLDAVVDIIDGAFANGYRYITTYLKNTDLIRVTGYLVKKSEVEKFRNGEAVMRDTTWFGSGTDECAQVFDRQLRDEKDVNTK